MALPASRSRGIALVGLSIAIIAVSAWVTVPLGPVPFTLQIFAVTFVMTVLPPRLATMAIAGYLLLGLIGVPVFSGFRGGLGVLLGPTGGFLWGYMVGVPLGSRLIAAADTRSGRRWPLQLAGALLYLGIAYVCGCLQCALVLGIGLPAAFMTSVAPFIVLDLIKVVIALRCALAMRASLGITSTRTTTN